MLSPTMPSVSAVACVSCDDGVSFRSRNESEVGELTMTEVKCTRKGRKADVCCFAISLKCCAKSGTVNTQRLGANGQAKVTLTLGNSLNIILATTEAGNVFLDLGATFELFFDYGPDERCVAEKRGGCDTYASHTCSGRG